MQNENIRKMVKIFIVAFLCSEMKSIQSPSAHRSKTYPSSINGTEATLDGSKHHASIRLSAEDGIFGDGHLCSGAVIAPSVVLTVAQCVFNNSKDRMRHPSELKVVMGTLNRYQRTAYTLSYGVTHIYQLSAFNPLQILDNNIAILMLERDIPDAHPTVQPITSNMEHSYDTSTVCELTSWGVTKAGVPITHLMSLNSTKLDEKSCLPVNGMSCLNIQYYDLKVCPTDAGAPVLCQGQLLGLLSKDHVCSVNTASATYVEVAYYNQWILAKIGSGTNQNSSIWGTLGFLLFTVFTLKSANLVKFSRH